MERALRIQVRFRAGDRCEYCHIRQLDEPYHSFHIEHIIARQHGGTDDPENLALCCHHCNLHKGPNLTAIDQETSQVVLLFHPRRQVWEEHFAMQGALIVALTPVGRASVRLLQMNAPSRMELRMAAKEPGQP